MDGKVTTLKVDVDADGIFDDGIGFYTIDAWAGEYVYEATNIAADEVEWVGVDVLNVGSNNESIWDYASCHEGSGEDNTGYVTLADNCKLYDLTGDKVTEIKATDLKIDTDANPNVNELGYESTNCVVGGWDSYGFATVVYVIDATNA
jgi:hypothetical protein